MISNPPETNAASRPLVIVGAGGHGQEVLWVAARMSLETPGGAWNVIGFVDDRLSLRGRMIEGLPILGTVQEFLFSHAGRPLYFHCAVGNNQERQKLAKVMLSEGFQPATIIDPMTVVSPRADIGAGAYIAPRVYVGPLAKIGQFALINVASSIGHHAVMGDYTQACPGVRVNGHCVIERMAFLGSNAVVHPGKRVGENTTVAANSFVVRDTPANTMVVGVPAKTVHQMVISGQESAPDDLPLPESTAVKTQVS